MKFCPYYGHGCNFADEDINIVQTHVVNTHPAGPPKGKPTSLKARTGADKMDGTKLTEDERRDAILASLPDDRYVCPFCWKVWPHARACRMFLDNGKLSTMAFCNRNAGGCGTRMQVSTMLWYRKPPRDFGREMGAYEKLWKKIHEAIGKANTGVHDEEQLHRLWMDGLRRLYPRIKTLDWDSPEQPGNQFWLGFADANPRFAEKQRIARAEREYAEAGRSQGQSDDDTPDEGGR